MRYLSRLLLLNTAAAGLFAGTIIVADPFNLPGNSDVIGNKLLYDAQSVQVTTAGAGLTIDIFTNFANSGLYSFRDPALGGRQDIGDLFFTVDGAYAYGIPLAYHNGPAGGPWGDRLYAGHVYEIVDPASALLTARQSMHDPVHVDYRPDVIVSMLDLGGVRDVTAGSPLVQVVPIPGNDGANGPLYDIRVHTSLPPGLFASPAANYGLHFAVATDGNDVVDGPLRIQNPEPSTLYLVIGAVLVLASRLGRRA